MNEPYARFSSSDLTLRDELAIDRTLLANERTLLAYARSGVTLMLAGVTFVHFAHQEWFRVIGYLSVPLGIVIIGFGVLRYRHVKAKIDACRSKLNQAPASSDPANPRP